MKVKTRDKKNIQNNNYLFDRINLGKAKLHFPLPNLVEAHLNSFNKFLNEDLVRYFELINPITDNTGKLWSFEFINPVLKRNNKTEQECLKYGLTYDAPLYWKVRLINLQTGEAKEQEIFMADIPLMTDRGTFIFNGKERVVIHQIVRAEGFIITKNNLFYNNKPLFQVKIIPSMGSWFTIDTSKTGVISIKLGPKRPKINICTFLRAMGYSSDAEILSLFSTITHNEELPNLIEISLTKDPTNNTTHAIQDIYNRLRPDVAANLSAAKQYIDSLLFDPKKIYLGEVGRYQLNKKLEENFKKEINKENSIFHTDDIIGIVRKLLLVTYGHSKEDDIDHLGNRRIRSINEFLGEVVLSAIKRIEKNTQDKMSLHSTDELLTAADVISTKPLANAFNDFFGTSQISRYMNQKNVLSELSNLRSITIAGPGGLTKERATFSVRDIQYSQYGRICVVQTPEGVNIGVVNQLSIYAKVNNYGFIEVPYRKVKKEVELSDSLNRILTEDLYSTDNKLLLKKGTKIKEKDLKVLLKHYNKNYILKVKPFLTGEIEYLDSDAEMNYKKTHALVNLDEDLNILDEILPIRYQYEFYNGNSQEIDYVDVDPAVIAGLNFSLMPMGHHTEAGRTLIEASNMNQAMPLVNAEPPIVGTGLEKEVAKLCGRSIYAKNTGIVEYVDAKTVVVKTDEGKDVYNLTTFQPSNDNTLIHNYPQVKLGQRIEKGDLIADSASTRSGEMSIGTNILSACMFYDGGTFEDGFIISDRLLKDGKFTTVIIRTYTRDIRETKLGPEELTSDIPGINESLLSHLNTDGIIRKGALVKPGDILAGIVSPTGDIEMTAEEKLLRAIFGESAHDVKDVSLRMPHGEHGVVIDTLVLDKNDIKLDTGVIKQVKIWVAELHEINIGDKLCDFAGQKGVIAKIVPQEDMPYLEDGTPVDLIFNPLFLKRMNVSCIKEMNLGMKAKKAGVKIATPLFNPIDETMLDSILQESGVCDFNQDKYVLYDGRTGEKFDRNVAVGFKYFLKLIHIAEEKIHARSTGPYTIVTQQPIGGKAQFGGQRFGEMEVWALEAHGAAHILQEMLTIKSDDVDGRAETYKNITQGEEPKTDTLMPQSFKVLLNELRALGLDISLMNRKGEKIDLDS